MSKRTSTKINKNTSNSKPSNSNQQQYNVIINQNSTFNQDNSINIMLDGNFPYFQNYNLQSNETEFSNQIYPIYDYQKVKNPKDTINNKNIEISNKKDNNNDKDNDLKNNEQFFNSLEDKKLEKSPSKRNTRNNLPYEEMEQESTNKIDYRYVKKCPLKEIISTFKNDEENNINNDQQYFWFATYDKLMKTKHLIKILNYYNNKPFDQQSNNNINFNLKEKTLIVKDFEIYFHENSNKPLIRYARGGTIYTKLYLLALKEISLIFSYINRIEYDIDYDKLNYLQKKGEYEVVTDNNNGIILPYCLIYCLGKYMNINIFSFSNNIDLNIHLDEISFDKKQRISSYTVLNNNKDDDNYFSNDNAHVNNKMNNTNINRFNYKLPNSKKIAKLVKIINLNFPDFSIEDIINYLIPENKYINSITKKNEIKNIFFFKKSAQNKYILSSMVRDTIKGISIHTPKSLISSFCPCESIVENGSFKNSDLFQPTNKKYMFPIKDDYKFQTINTNEKDNNKSNPFIIYVCDNVQKINFVDSQNQPQNQNIQNTEINEFNINPDNTKENNYNNIINDIDDNKNYLNIDSSRQKNENNRYKNDIRKTDINVKKENTNANINDNNTNNNIRQSNYQINNKSKKIPKEKINNEKIKEAKETKEIKEIKETKKKQNKYGNNINNVFKSGNKKGLKIQRISTDINERKKSINFMGLTGTKNNKNKIRDSNAISHTNMIGNKNVKKLNKSIESHNNYNPKFRLSRTSDISQRRKQNIKNNNNALLIKRVNMNKKDLFNPFYKTES